jgi:hypothetical protein
MIKLPKKDQIIGVGFRTLNEEYYLSYENSKKFVDKFPQLLKFKSDWQIHNVNEPRRGDIYPGFVKATFKILLEKMGWKNIDKLSDVHITKQKAGGKKLYAIFMNFEATPFNPMVGKNSPVNKGRSRGFTKPIFRRKKK